MRVLFLVLAVLAFASIGTARKSFEGYEVLSVDVNSKKDLEFLKPYTLKSGYDFWKLPRLGGKAQIMGKTETLAKLRSLLSSKDIHSDVIVPNVEDLLAQERNSTRRGGRSLTWDAYYTWEAMEPWIQGLEANNNADVTVVGKSSENRNIYMVKVSTGPSTSGTPKKAIFIDANIHAREWISSAAATYVINELTTNPGAHADLLDSVDLYIIPMANPDGYVFTHEENRFWRKTRSIHPNPPETCGDEPEDADESPIGADPNRNFGFMWGGESTSPDPCTEIFPGTEPWSEPEVRAIRDAQLTIRNGGQEIQSSISLHSYGNVWLLSWGWTEGVYPEDYDELLAWGERVVERIQDVDGTVFETGQGADIFYGVGGASDDYAKSVGIKYATTAELRAGTGNSLEQFILPAEQIILTGREVMAGIKETGRTIVADGNGAIPTISPSLEKFSLALLTGILFKIFQ